jgi:8-oxo-dGTP pyrophosphatase MutT (NUDIX family)
MHPYGADEMCRQSGVIPYRDTDACREILLITSKKKGNWIIPKGIVEPHLSAPVSAQKEAFEEAGVMGDVRHEPVGVYHTHKWGGRCIVQVYPMRVTAQYAQWPEQDARSRQWFSIDRAVTRPVNRELQTCIAQLRGDRAA